MSEQSNNSSQPMMSLMLEQLQATAALTERITHLEVEVYKIQAGQTRLLLFAGFVGAAGGYVLSNLKTVLTTLKSAFL